MPNTIYQAPAGAVREISQDEYERRADVKITQKRALRIKHKFGIDPAEYLAALARQDACCATCRTPEGEMWNKLEPDYDLATRKLFALVCKPCGQALAAAKRDPALLRALADHLERYSKE